MWRESIRGKNVLRERNGRERIELRKNRTERKVFHRERETESGGVFIKVSISKILLYLFFLKN